MSVGTLTNSGALVISLDFELHWGIRDHTSIADARETLLGARRAVEALLALFAAREIHATWATVGMLFAHTREELFRHLPERRPNYLSPALSPYNALDTLGRGEDDDPFHFAGSLVDKIAATPGQELGTHTFSHLYCLERGVTVDDFEADLQAARRIGERHGDVVQSIVFPRNQLNPDFLPVLARNGVRNYRENPSHWAFAPRSGEEEKWRHRAVRLADAYLPVTGTRATPWPPAGRLPRPVHASAFLRPYSRKLAPFDALRVARIRGDLRAAAREGRMFHLWWHPHNFGQNLAENLRVLGAILDEFDSLRRQGGMVSATMAEVAEAEGR